MVFVVYLDKIMNCSECEIQQILTKLVCLKQHDQKIYNHFILKLVGLVVVLSGWSRYSRGGGTKCHRSFLTLFNFSCLRKKYTFSEFYCNVQKKAQIQWICWMYREEKQIPRILLKSMHCTFVVSQSVRPQQKLIISFVAAMTLALKGKTLCIYVDKCSIQYPYICFYMDQVLICMSVNLFKNWK